MKKKCYNVDKTLGSQIGRSEESAGPPLRPPLRQSPITAQNVQIDASSFSFGRYYLFKHVFVRT